MSTRSITLRILLLALAAAAAMAVLAVLAPSNTSGKALGGAVVLAIAAALILPGTPGTAGQSFRVAGATWCSFVTLGAAGIEASIWGPFFIADRVMPALLILAGSLVVVFPALRRVDGRDTSLRRAEWTLIGGVSVASIIGVIGAITQIPTLSEKLIIEWSLTLGLALLAAAAAVGHATGATRSSRLLGHLTLACAVISFGCATATNLGNSTISWTVNDVTQAALLTCGLATAGGAWIIITAARLQGPARLLRSVAVAATLSATVAWVIALEANLYGWMERTAAAATIVDGCALMAAMVSFLMGRADRQRAAGAIREVRLHCPRCDKQIALPLGESPCPRCALVVVIGVRETSCPQCNYDLRSTPQGAPCPECGRLSQAATAAMVAPASPVSSA